MLSSLQRNVTSCVSRLHPLLVWRGNVFLLAAAAAAPFTFAESRVSSSSSPVFVVYLGLNYSPSSSVGRGAGYSMHDHPSLSLNWIIVLTDSCTLIILRVTCHQKLMSCLPCLRGGRSLVKKARSSAGRRPRFHTCRCSRRASRSSSIVLAAGRCDAIN